MAGSLQCLMMSPKVLFTSHVPIDRRPSRCAHNSAFNVCNELSRHKIQYCSFNSSLVDHITSHPRPFATRKPPLRSSLRKLLVLFYMQLISFQSVLKRRKLVFYFCTSYSWTFSLFFLVIKTHRSGDENVMLLRLHIWTLYICYLQGFPFNGLTLVCVFLFRCKMWKCKKWDANLFSSSKHLLEIWNCVIYFISHTIRAIKINKTRLYSYFIF